MAGIYVHIPFCRQACHYCNFHFSTSFKYKSELVSALAKELIMRKDYIQGATIETIYFGGGTPSLLEEKELNVIMETLHKQYKISQEVETTLEANPDDLTVDKLRQLKSSGINRLSIGIQSFHEVDLKWMNRSHNAAQARNSIVEARNLGFENLSIDLIFGCPTTTEENWQQNLDLVSELDIPHISCYGLTIEEKTALAHQVKTQSGSLPKEESNAQQFLLTMNHLESQGYEQYEISNYAKNQLYSKHNTNYWKQVPYLGIGPSAHSFDGRSRQWTQPNNSQYIKNINEGRLPSDSEVLSSKDLYNEYVLTHLRTIWGCNTNSIKSNHTNYVEHFRTEVSPLIQQGLILQSDNQYTLTTEGKFIADKITAQLFVA